VGSSYDNAAAEALNKSYKRELVWRDGPWKGRDDLETATARWVDWYNRTRPHLTNDDDLPPTTVEHRYNHNHPTHHRITNPPQNPGLSTPAGELHVRIGDPLGDAVDGERALPAEHDALPDLLVRHCDPGQCHVLPPFP